MKQINLTKFKQLLFFIILSFAPFLLEAQQKVQVKGKVVDAVTNNPLNGVSVTVKNSAYGTTTNAEGVFTIDFTQGEKLILPATSGIRVEADTEDSIDVVISYVEIS